MREKFKSTKALRMAEDWVERHCDLGAGENGR